MPRMSRGKAAPPKEAHQSKLAGEADRDASDEEFRRAFEAERPRWVDLADRLK